MRYRSSEPEPWSLVSTVFIPDSIAIAPPTARPTTLPATCATSTLRVSMLFVVLVAQSICSVRYLWRTLKTACESRSATVLGRVEREEISVMASLECAIIPSGCQGLKAHRRRTRMCPRTGWLQPLKSGTAMMVVRRWGYPTHRVPHIGYSAARPRYR